MPFLTPQQRMGVFSGAQGAMAVRCHVYMLDCEPFSYAGDVYAHNILVGDSAKPTLLDYGDLPPSNPALPSLHP